MIPKHISFPSAAEEDEFRNKGSSKQERIEEDGPGILKRFESGKIESFGIGLASIVDVVGGSQPMLVLSVVPLSLGYITCTFASGELGKWENHNLHHYHLSLNLCEFPSMIVHVTVLSLPSFTFTEPGDRRSFVTNS